MKRFSLRWFPYEIALRTPLVTGQGAIRRRRGLLLQLVDVEGAVGCGDVAPWPGRETVELPEAIAWLEEVRDAVEGGASAGVLATDARQSRGAFAARAALETALLDREARCAGVPLARWLRTEAADRVPVNAVLGLADTETTVRRAQEAVVAGFRTLKLKVQPTLVDAERVAAVRATVGRDVRLRLDANGAADVATALAFARAVAPLEVEYLEQPVATLEELAELRRRSPVPLAADEALVGLAAVERALALDAADALVLKVPLLGGPRVALAAAERARARGVDVVLTGMLESGVGLAAALHAAAAVGGGRAHGLATAHLVEPLGVVEPLEPVDGMLALPDAPGLGVTVRPVDDEGVR
ncbi:MAG: mandelate racemase/muconate lactonizing enzyme family protein [Thermomicrobium sp.]|nr:mandelate racemase/muconate lactonizing enzyme family protein [Thermomicrobium sp.]